MSATDFSKKLDEIHELAARTSQDVIWIRDGMKRGEERMDGHDTEICDIKAKVAHSTGRSSMLGALVGAVISGIGTFLLGHKFT